MRKVTCRTNSIVMLATLIPMATGTALQAVGLAPPSAQELMNRMAETYSSCRTYQDRGVVTTVFLQDNGGKRTTIRPFTTAFVRPDRFRFEFQSRRGEDEWNRYIVYRNGESVRTWWSVRPGSENKQSLSMALAGATGVSGSSAHTIPRLLLPHEVTGTSLAELTDPKLLGEEDVAGVSCFKMQGTYFRGQIRTLWIDKKSYLVMKIFAVAEFSDFRTETTTTYEPQLNVEIRSADLEFNSPSEAAFRETGSEATATRKFSIPAKNMQIPSEMVGCAENLQEIYQAIKKYETDKGRLPSWLSDLVPDYLSNEGLYCPNDTEHRADFSPDPGLRCSYAWEFSNLPIPAGWDPTGTVRYRDWKNEQIKLLGEVVPMVRCSHHDRRWLNLSVGGQVWWGERDWEYMFISDYGTIHKQILSRMAASRPATAPQQPSLLGATAPSFTLRDLSGREVSLSDFRGQVVLLDFWATWCGPCRNAIPHLEALHQKYEHEGLAVIGMNNERDHDKVKQFAAEQMSYLVLVDADRQFKAYGIRAIPTAFYIDREGKIRRCEVGFRPGAEKEVERRIRELLGIREGTTSPSASSAEEVSGNKLLQGTWAWDIDSNSDGPKTSVDVWGEHVNRQERYLVPTNGAGITVVIGSAFEDLHLGDLRKMDFADSRISASDATPVIDVGTVLAVRTTEGNLAKLEVTGFDPLKSSRREFTKYDMRLRYVLYKVSPAH